MDSRSINVQTTPERLRYYDKLYQRSLSPLWERLNILLTPEPQTRSQPHLWDYDEMRDLLLESAEVISAHEAERRVLVLDNPGLADVSAISEVLYAGWQLVMPGEVAPAHRHSPSALRFIIEGDGGAYTAVNGEKAYMLPGDMILTPSWCWHDHGNEGKEPVVWLDVLDMPLIRNLGPIFLELYPDDRFPEGYAPETTNQLFGNAMRPVGYDHASVNSPMFHYPYETARKALMRAASEDQPDPCQGTRLEYINPINGTPALATISTQLMHFAAGFSGKAYRSTEAMVFCAVEGHGKVQIEHGGRHLEYAWKPRDTFVIPCWATQHWQSEDDSILFCASDRGMQQRLGLWREERPTP